MIADQPTTALVPVGRAARAHLAWRLVDLRPARDGGDTLYKESLGQLPDGEEVFFYSSRNGPRTEARAELEESFLAAWMVAEAERQVVAGIADQRPAVSGSQANRERADLAAALLRAAGAPVRRWIEVAANVAHRDEYRAQRQRQALRQITEAVRIAGPARPYVDRFGLYPSPRSAQWEGRVEFQTDGRWSVSWKLHGIVNEYRNMDCRIAGRVGSSRTRGGDGIREAALLRAASVEVAEGLWNIYRGFA